MEWEWSRLPSIMLAAAGHKKRVAVRLPACLPCTPATGLGSSCPPEGGAPLLPLHGSSCMWACPLHANPHNARPSGASASVDGMYLALSHCMAVHASGPVPLHANPHNAPPPPGPPAATRASVDGMYLALPHCMAVHASGPVPSHANPRNAPPPHCRPGGAQGERGRHVPRRGGLPGQPAARPGPPDGEPLGGQPVCSAHVRAVVLRCVPRYRSGCSGGWGCPVLPVGERAAVVLLLWGTPAHHGAGAGGGLQCCGALLRSAAARRGAALRSRALHPRTQPPACTAVECTHSIVRHAPLTCQPCQPAAAPRVPARHAHVHGRHAHRPVAPFLSPRFCSARRQRRQPGPAVHAALPPPAHRLPLLEHDHGAQPRGCGGQ